MAPDQMTELLNKLFSKRQRAKIERDILGAASNEGFDEDHIGEYIAKTYGVQQIAIGSIDPNMYPKEQPARITSTPIGLFLEEVRKSHWNYSGCRDTALAQRFVHDTSIDEMHFEDFTRDQQGLIYAITQWYVAFVVHNHLPVSNDLKVWVKIIKTTPRNTSPFDEL